ncbi:hypothetical protein HY483_03735 [Candidatus Woesearchaeota archaeon]|nr:hypothetical protein [Candidatus Woesearchaeota archaeon]
MGDDVNIGMKVLELASEITAREGSLRYVLMHTHDDAGVFLLYKDLDFTRVDDEILREIFASGGYESHFDMCVATPVDVKVAQEFGFSFSNDDNPIVGEDGAVVYFGTKEYVKNRVPSGMLKE